MKKVLVGMLFALVPALWWGGIFGFAFQDWQTGVGVGVLAFAISLDVLFRGRR